MTDIVYSYELEDFYGVIRSGFQSMLTPETMAILKQIESNIVSTNVVEAPVFTRSYKSSSRPSAASNSNRSTTWTPVEKFKTTKLDKKEGIDQKINDIRISLNKISNKNYETQRDSIFSTIKLIGESKTDLEKIASAIYDIASTNKFYSETYATLYKELMELYPIFTEILQSFLSNFSQVVTEWKYVDSNTASYDEVSQYNKKNDSRKATAVFLVHLMKKNVIEINSIVNIIHYLQSLLLEYVEEPNKTNEIEEITELLFLFISEGVTSLKTSDSWQAIFAKVESFSKIVKADKKPSYTSRAIYKHMDLLAIIKK